MMTFEQFRARCKMRHDFADQIQVRYRHRDGEDYDTWVSGEEVMARLRSEAAESRLRDLGRLRWEDVRDAREEIPEEGKRRLHDWFKEQLADNVEDLIGGNVIGDSLADAVRGRNSGKDPETEARLRWQVRLRDAAFRAVTLELAWVNLRGSFPDEDMPPTHEDWV